MELNRLLKKKQKAIEDGNKKTLAELCNKLGNYYASEEQYEKAISEFKEESSIYENLNQKIDYARANRMIGEVLMLQGNPKDALKYEELYLKLAKEENDLVEMQRAYTTVGRCHLLIGGEIIEENSAMIEYKSAEKTFLKGLLLCKEIGKSVSKYEMADMQTRLYLNLGITKEHEQKFDDAANHYKTALKISTSNDLFEAQHQSLMGLGSIAAKNDDTSSAMQAYNNALEIAKRVDSSDNKIKMCETLLAKSELLIKNGDYQSAKQVLKKAYRSKTSVRSDMNTIEKNLKIVHALCKYEDDLVVTDSFDYEKRKVLFEKLGDGSCKLKNYAKAIDFYQKQLESAELNGETGRKLIPIYVSLYQTYIDMGEHEKALKFLNMEYELIKDEPKEACLTLVSMGNLLNSAKRDFWEIDATFRKALSEARKCDDVSMEKSVLKRLIAICKEHKMISLAEILENEAAERDMNLNDECSDDFSEDILDSCDILDNMDFELSTDAESSEEERKKRSQKSCATGARRKKSMTVKKNVKGETKLHEACINGNYQLVKMLLDQGHAVNVRDNAGWLPLHEAANHGFRDVVELLLDNGAQSAINDRGGVNCDGITPLYDAASNGHLRVVQLLLERGAKATIKTNDNLTPLDALMYWYSDNYENMSLSERTFYEEVKDRLTEQCEKVGIDTNKPSLAISSLTSSGYSSAKSKSSQQSSSLQSQQQKQGRRNNMRFNTNFSDDSDEDDNDNEKLYEQVERQQDNDEKKKKRLDKKMSATLEYKSVMQKLKHPNKDKNLTASNDVVESSSCNIKRRSAYLKEQEVDLDDWLDDDLGPTKKKQKFYNKEQILKSSEKILTNLIDSSPKKSNLPRVSSSHSLVVDDIENNLECLSDFDVNSIDAFDLMMNTNGEGNKKKLRRNSNSMKIRRQNSNSNQSLLFDAGFSRFIEQNESTGNSYFSPSKKSSSPSNSSIHETYNRGGNSSYGSNNQVEKQAIIKVQIDDEKIIVPINRDAVNDLKISWLADESARRYYCLKGIRPELKLKTVDGATLIETDPLSLILGCLTKENLILSEILDWKLPSLSNRYLEACSEYKCGVDREIVDFLDLNRVAINIDLSNQNLKPAVARPILKALQHQNCLAHLDFSSNFLQDEGLKYLSQTLITLKRLTYLDMSGNAISEAGMEHFCSTLLKSPNPTMIECLKLNFNPIKSNSLRHLSELCRNKSISTLCLSSCELVTGSGVELLNNIKQFDISYNHFTANGLRDVLRSLNATIIESLNLERCSSDSYLGETIVNFITSGCSVALREINLSALKLNENEILEILRSLQNCENLINLNLSYQHELTILSLKYILFDMNNRNLRVSLIGCRNLQNTSDIINIQADKNHQQQAHPCQVQMSIPKTLKETSRDDYIALIRQFWLNVSGNQGNVHCEKNVLHLLGDQQDVHSFF